MKVTKEMLWADQVPLFGQSETVEGELLRAVERIRWQAFNYAHAHWDAHYDHFANYLREHLCKDYANLETDIDAISTPDTPCYTERVYDRIVVHILKRCEKLSEYTKREIDETVKR